MINKYVPNYEREREEVQHLLEMMKITSFPISILNIINNLINIQLRAYSSIDKEILHSLKVSDDAFTISGSNNEYTICYNDNIKEKTTQRIRFSLAHELGHIMMGHFEYGLSILKRGKLSNKKYLSLEKEADAFAADLLAPIEMITSNWDAKYISNIFQISLESAKIKVRVINNFKYYRLQNHDFNIKKPIIENNYYDKTYFICKNCNCYFENRKVKSKKINNGQTRIYTQNLYYCPICGNNNLKEVKDNKLFNFTENIIQGEIFMRYSEVPVNNNGLALECPNCNYDNEDRTLFCKICGKYLKNSCTGHSDDYYTNQFGDDIYASPMDIYNDANPCDNGKSLDGQSRYCPFCGATTTFLEEGILKPFNIEMEEQQNLPFN